MSQATASNYFGITETNIRLLFAGSVLKNHVECKLECLKFIQTNMSMENCVSYFKFSVQEESQELRKHAVTFIKRNIQELGSQQEFLNLSADEIELLLIPIVSENQAANTNEPEDQESVTNLFVSIYKWMTADATLRVETFYSISSKFPLSQVDADILCKIFKEDKNLSQNSVGVNLYLCAMERKYFEDREMYNHRTGSLRVPPVHVAQHPSPVLVRCHESANEESNFITRKDSGTDKNLQGRQAVQSKPMRSTEENRKRSFKNVDIELLEEVPYKRSAPTTTIDLTECHSNTLTAETWESQVPKIYFMSGSSTGITSLMEMNLTDFTTKSVADFPFEEKCTSLMYHENKIIAICNKEDRDISQVVRYLSLKKKVWVEMPSLNIPRFRFGWTLAQNSIYVLGGLATTGQIEESVERFWDPFSVVNGHWVTVGASPHPRADHAVGLIGNQIYVVGGVRSSTSLRISKSMDAFHIETKKWSRKAEMPSKKTGLCVAVVDSRLYAIGGGEKVNIRKESRTCAVYIPEKDEWNSIAPLNQARQDASAFVLDRNIYVVGGNRGLPTMERYDVDKNTWTIVQNCRLPTEGHYRHVAFART